MPPDIPGWIPLFFTGLSRSVITLSLLIVFYPSGSEKMQQADKSLSLPENKQHR